MELSEMYVSGAYGRQLLRTARQRSDLRIEAEGSPPLHIDAGNRAGELPDLGVFGLQAPTSSNAIDLWFADAQSRRQQPDTLSHVSSDSLPEDAFVGIHTSTGEVIHCEGPGLSVLLLARELEAAVRSGHMQRPSAIVRLVTYVMELAGTYACASPAIAHNKDAFFLEPAASVESLATFLGKMRGYSGVALARQATRLAQDGSASRMETLSFLTTSLPPRLGGTPIGAAELNHALELSARELRSIKHRTIRPDLLWRAYRMVVEYDGRDPHSAPKQKREDKYRFQDYQTLGYTVFPITYEDVSTIGALDRLLMRLIEVVGRFRGDQYVRNMRHFLRDVEQRAKRMRLLASLLPPITRYGEV